MMLWEQKAMYIVPLLFKKIYETERENGVTEFLTRISLMNPLLKITLEPNIFKRRKGLSWKVRDPFCKLFSATLRPRISLNYSVRMESWVRQLLGATI